MAQQARTHADLNAMLVGQKSAPKGCHVLNVSPQGMLLQCKPDGRLLSFREGDPIDIHLSVQHAGKRKQFTIPAIVNHVDIKRIDVVFQQPNNELLKLIEAYRVSDAHMVEGTIAHSKQEADTEVSERPKKDKATPAIGHTDSESGKRRSHTALYLVLLTIILSVCIAAGAYLYTSDIDNRLSVLETITIRQTNELAEIRSRIFSSNLQEGRYASLNARIQTLTDAFGSLEDKLDKAISGQPVTAETEKPITIGREIPISITPLPPAYASNDKPSALDNRDTAVAPAQDRPDEPQLAATEVAGSAALDVNQAEPRSPALLTVEELIAGATYSTETQPTDSDAKSPGSAGEGISKPDTTVASNTTESMAAGTSTAVGDKSGPWIINLLSSRRSKDTERLAGIAEKHGIPVVQSKAIVKGKKYWRLQITGFRNAREAKEYAIPVKKNLGISDVWIFKQKP